MSIKDWFFPENKLNIIGREKFTPIHLCRGDTLDLTVTILDESTGREEKLNKKILAEEAVALDELVTFTTLYEGRKAFGAMALATDNKDNE